MSVINWHTTSGNQRYFYTGGGTGFIGKALVRSLKQAGHEVTIISRSKAPGRITWVSGIKHFSPHLFFTYNYQQVTTFTVAFCGIGMCHVKGYKKLLGLF